MIPHLSLFQHCGNRARNLSDIQTETPRLQMKSAEAIFQHPCFLFKMARFVISEKLLDIVKFSLELLTLLFIF
jgi:hypothetical protein